MAKRKTATKSTKAKSASKKRGGITNGLYATEHDFIIIIGGGLVVVMLTVFLFLFQ